MKRLREKGAYIRNNGSGMKCNWDDDLKHNIEEILGEDSDLEVNKIKERLVENIQKIWKKLDREIIRKLYWFSYR